MTITGGTQAVSVFLAIARMKALALLVGPAGVGVLSLYSNLQSTASALAGLGLGNSGVRQIAQAKGEIRELSRVRRVLLAANLLQGAIAMAAIWLLRKPMAAWLFGDRGYGLEVGLVGIAVFLTLFSASQTALLRGMRRIENLGRVTVLGALAGTVGGVAAVWAYGMNGLVLFVLIQPLTTVVVAAYFTRKLPKATPEEPMALGEVWRIWKPMVQVGSGFMLSGLATAGTLLLVRSKIATDLGLDAAGQFAAAWSITMTYVGFLLSAMSMDYYPRLAEIIHDQPVARRLMNEQLQIGLAIGGPVLLLLIGLAPAAIWILYSAEFTEAVTLLQWQTAGNVFKLASWPLSFSIVAAARSKTFVLLEASFLLPFGTLIYLFLPTVGLLIAGMAFLLCQMIYFGVSFRLAAGINGFRLEQLSLKLIIAYGAAGLALLVLSLASPLAGALAAIAMSVTSGFVGGHILLEKIGPNPRTAPLARVYAACGWPIGAQS